MASEVHHIPTYKTVPARELADENSDTFGPQVQLSDDRLIDSIQTNRIFVHSFDKNEGNGQPRSYTTASPLNYILQAALGQCSTLPVDARNEPTAFQSTTGSKPYSQEQPYNTTWRNPHTMAEQWSDHVNTSMTRRQKYPESGGDHQWRVPNMNQQSPVTNIRFSNVADGDVPSPSCLQQRKYMIRTGPHDEKRDGYPHPPPSPIPIPAVRTRCYKLNLDSDFVGVTSVLSTEGQLLGPFDGRVPSLTYSASEDSSVEYDATDVVIQTAQIFRGITVARDGTILSQNARATRSNNGKTNQMGETSRQAAKIEESKDLVEESILTGKVSSVNHHVHMACLEISSTVSYSSYYSDPWY